MRSIAPSRLAAVVALAPLAILLACPARDLVRAETVNVTGAGEDASVPTEGARDPRTAYCAALASQIEGEGKCLGDDPCWRAMVRDCTRIAAYFDDAYIDAFVACAPSFRCKGLLEAGLVDLGLGHCIDARLAGLEPTAAQQALARAYCAHQKGGASEECIGAFFAVPDLEGGFTDNPTAWYLRGYSDAVIDRITQACVLDAGRDAAWSDRPFGYDFELTMCSLREALRAMQPPSECVDGGIWGGLL
jgi:hypothetical protein